jgi:hypothetical protein
VANGRVGATIERIGDAARPDTEGGGLRRRVSDILWSTTTRWAKTRRRSIVWKTSAIVSSSGGRGASPWRDLGAAEEEDVERTMD